MKNTESRTGRAEQTVCIRRKDGSPAGFEYEVLKKIDDQNKNIKLEYSTLEYQNALIGLKEGKYDLVSGTFFRTPAREKDYLVTKPYNYYFLNLIVNPNSKIKTMEDLNGKSVVPIESTDGRYVAFRDWQKKHPNVKIKMEASLHPADLHRHDPAGARRYI